MTYYEFVNAPRFLRRKVEHKIEDVKLKEAACMNTTVEFKERVQTSPVNTTEISYARYIDAKNELDRMMGDLQEVQDKVRSFFGECLWFDEADMLEWKYIECKSTHEIANIIGIAPQTAKNKMSKAEKKAKAAWAKKIDR